MKLCECGFGFDRISFKSVFPVIVGDVDTAIGAFGLNIPYM